MNNTNLTPEAIHDILKLCAECLYAWHGDEEANYPSEEYRVNKLEQIWKWMEANAMEYLLDAKNSIYNQPIAPTSDVGE